MEYYEIDYYKNENIGKMIQDIEFKNFDDIKKDKIKWNILHKFWEKKCLSYYHTNLLYKLCKGEMI